MTSPLIAALLLAAQTTITVGPTGQHRTIADAVNAASAGDTVVVSPGVYREQPVITRPITLLGQPGAVIDGGGQGIVLTIRAQATISGFVIRASGARQVEEHAGILAEGAPGVVIEDNVLEDVLFGIYLKQSHNPLIRRNTVRGKDIAVAQRGDGIRLWYSHGGVIVGNVVTRVRDLVIWFSDSTVASDNRVSDSRYGLHYMYSDHNRFERNEFIHNHVGAFLMYSTDIVFRDNVFADARGTTGRGLGFKDTDRVQAEHNVLVRNAIGIAIDNSPSTVGIVNLFEDNVIAFNDVGVSLLPSVHSNRFRGNAFLDNVRSVAVTGAGTAIANEWRGNYWTDYAGFDADRDRRGDTPFVYERFSDDLFAKHEALQLFDFGPSMATLNTLSKVFPLLQPKPIAIDSFPQLDQQLRLTDESHSTRSTRGSALVFLGAAVLAVGTVLGFRRSPGSFR